MFFCAHVVCTGFRLLTGRPGQHLHTETDARCYSAARLFHSRRVDHRDVSDMDRFRVHNADLQLSAAARLFNRRWMDNAHPFQLEWGYMVRAELQFSSATVLSFWLQRDLCPDLEWLELGRPRVHAASTAVSKRIFVRRGRCPL